MIKSNFLRISLLLAVAVGVVAQQPDRLQKHIKHLSSDALEGRRTGSKGATEAARYVASEFSRLKLKSLTGGYLQKFPYVAGVTLGKGNALSFGTDKLESSTDWLPLGFSSPGKVSGGLVFVGYGITASELNHDDYANANAAGKIAIALQGTPDGANPHGRFARFEGVRWKAVAARNAGAKALIVIARETNFKDDRLTKLVYDNMAGDAGLPVVVMSRQAADRLLALSNSSLSQLEQAPTARPLTGEVRLTTDVVRNKPRLTT